MLFRSGPGARLRQKTEEEMTRAIQDNPPTHSNINENWTSLKETILATAERVLGKSTKKIQDWFDENDKEIQSLITAKNTAFSNLLSGNKTRSKTKKFQDASRELQKRTREMKSKWWEAVLVSDRKSTRLNSSH